MHPKNPYATKKPDFGELAKKYPAFGEYVKTNDDGYSSIDFQDPAALRALTRVLLKEDWGYEVELREDRLCPTLANRLDYVLFLLDLAPHIWPIDSEDKGEGSSTTPLRFLDIGTGAIAIYPLLLHHLDPTCQIVATELDDISLMHARTTLTANNISQDGVSVLNADQDRILGPLFPTSGGDDKGYDFTLCNPPFFGSEEEMREGKDLKEERPHAAPTAASNELTTPGGEVTFVSKMIEESVELGERCRWYTSLIGKYASLQSLLRVLERRQIDNYFIKSIKQAKTARWILGWSHTATRLPDSLTRPSNLIPGTTFARILPPPNTISHTPLPALPIADLQTKVVEILRDIHLLPSDYVTPSAEEGWKVDIAPRRNTWSRQARRAAARGEAPTEAEAASPLFHARISVMPPARTASAAESEDGHDGNSEAKSEPAEPAGPSVSLDWLEGRDRTTVDALWKYLLNKAGLTIQSQHQAQGEKRHHDEVEAGAGGREYPPGHWRGGPPGNRGVARGRGRGGFEDRGGGRGRRGLGFGSRGGGTGGGASGNGGIGGGGGGGSDAS